jgi:histidyl-tRNA synthetase
MAYSGNLSKRMKKAARLGSSLAVLIGSEEIASGEVTVKDLQAGAQTKMKISQLSEQIESFLKDKV